MKKKWKIVMLITGIAAVLLLAWYFLWPRLDMKAVKEHIQAFAKDYNDPVAVEYILLQGVNEIRWRRASYLQAKRIAQEGGLPLERTIVDAAIAEAQDYNYI